jgi:hypothetical protein
MDMGGNNGVGGMVQGKRVYYLMTETRLNSPYVPSVAQHRVWPTGSRRLLKQGKITFLWAADPRSGKFLQSGVSFP